jgi:hypothetical protein
MEKFMLIDTSYNGWSNYATWRVNLEVFDGMEHAITDYIDEDGEEPDAYEFVLALEDLANEIIFSGMGYDERRPSTLAEDYARAFLQDVNWHEIAKHIIADHIAENQE